MTSVSSIHSFLADQLRRTPVGVIIWFGVFLVFAGILFQIRRSRLGYFVVTSASMKPTIQIGDRLVMKRPRQWHRGDIVVLANPDEPRAFLVKRIVALAPDRVAVRRGHLYVNNTPAPPPQGGEIPPAVLPDGDWTLHPDEVFVVGDNRAESKDSRDFGPIPTTKLRGVILYRVESLFHWVRVR
jgi:signal peptidase I